MKKILLPLVALILLISCSEKSIEKDGGMIVELSYDNNYTDTANLRNVLSKRLYSYELDDYNISFKNSIINIEIPEFKDSSIIEKLLCKTGNFEIKETYTNQEISPFLLELNDKIVHNDTTNLDTSDLINKHPLHNIMAPAVTQEGQIQDGAVVGYGKSKDTVEVNEYLKKYIKIFPKRLEFAWGTQYYPEEINVLLALKNTNNNIAPITENMVETANSESGYNKDEFIVSLILKEEYHKTWEVLTQENIGKNLAILIDNKVYFFPIVNSEIKGGHCQISRKFNEKEAKILAAYLSSGKLPCKINLKSISIK